DSSCACARSVGSRGRAQGGWNGLPAIPPESCALAPAQVVVLERNRPEPLACDLEDRIADRRRDLRNRFLARARDPALRLEEREVHLCRILIDARDAERV